MCSPGFAWFLFSFLANAFRSTSFTNELLPEPETPVTQEKVASGIFAFTFLRLFALAPIISNSSPLPFLRLAGTGINFYLKDSHQ